MCSKVKEKKMSQIVKTDNKIQSLKNVVVYLDGSFKRADVYVDNGIISDVCLCLNNNGKDVFCEDDLFIFPGFTDVHVHLREPGFLYKETVKTGTLAAAHGGYTNVCAMANLNPVPDCLEHLKIELDAIKKDACINVVPYGAITVGEQGEVLSQMDEMAPFVAGFSDDGRGVQNADMMETAMKKAKALNKIIVAHCEDNSLLRGGYIHDGEYARLNGHKGICSESEYLPIKRDIELVEKTGVSYHVCHVSAKESVDIIRQAKAEGVDITCETAPHYLILDDMMLKDEGRFKMNPPIRSREDRQALIEGIKDGTIDMIATDHAPHSMEEKSKGLEKSLMGIVGIENAFSLMYTHLVKTGIITLEKLIELMSVNPNKRFGFDSSIKKGNSADFTAFKLNTQYTINTDDNLSMGKSTPFEGEKVFGKCIFTVYKGVFVWQENLTEK